MGGDPIPRISFVETEPTHGALHIHDDCYSYQPKRGWRWLQKACLWILDRLRCHHCTEFTTYRRITIDRPASMAAIFEQQAKIGRIGQRAQVLLIGADDWAEIMRSDAPAFGPIGFDGEFFVPNLNAHGYSSPSRQKMRVCIVPWIKGMVLVPREALEHGS